MGKFSDQVMRFSVKAPEVALNVIRASVIELATRIIVLTPVDTGRARAGWQLSIGAPTTTSPTDYEWTTKGEEGGRIASEAIARVTGAAASITPGIKKIWLVNNVAYILPLEYGHSRIHAPQGMVRISLAEFQDIVKQLAGKK